MNKKNDILLSVALLTSCLYAAEDNLESLLKNPSQNCLQGKKIILTVEKAPNEDVPSTGAGDCLFYPRILKEYMQALGADEVALNLGSYKWLGNFFAKCTDIQTLTAEDAEGFTAIEVRDVLDALPDLHAFESKDRYLGANCAWANKEVEKITAGITAKQEEAQEKTGRSMHPVLFTRQSATYTIKSNEEEALFGYLNHRSISREELAEILQNKPAHVSVYNIQFEDQAEDDIAGTEKPVKIWDAYKERNGAFVNDALLMAAVLKVGGDVISIDSSPLNLAIGLPQTDPSRKNIKALLAQKHNSRWQKLFLNEDASVCWSPNVELIVQEKMDDWSTVGQALIESWQ